MVLGRLGETEPAVSQGALQAFRERLIANDMDRRLLEHTIELARTSGASDQRRLRADSTAASASRSVF